jgi:hypothetical protein
MFCIQQQKPLIRGSLEFNTAPVTEWRYEPHWGHHPTRLAAMRRYIEELDPDWKGAPDDMIRRQWRAWSRSHHVRTAPAVAGE